MKYSYSNVRNLVKKIDNGQRVQSSQQQGGVPAGTYRKKIFSKSPTPFSANKIRGAPLKSSASTSYTCRKSYKIPSKFNKTQKKNFGQLLKSHYSNHDRGNSTRINETNLTNSLPTPRPIVQKRGIIESSSNSNNHNSEMDDFWTRKLAISKSIRTLEERLESLDKQNDSTIPNFTSMIRPRHNNNQVNKVTP